MESTHASEKAAPNQIGREWIIRWLVGSALVSVLLDALAPDSVLAGDPKLFNVRANDMLAGSLPYVDAEFEHLPVMIPYILGGRALTGVMPGGNGALAYLLIGVALIGATTRLFTGERLGRWMMVSTPLLPIVLYRLDALPVMACAFALVGLLKQASTGEASTGEARTDRDGPEQRAAWWSVVGGLAKGWPIVVAPLLWRRGRPSQAVGVVGIVLGTIAALSFTPGFQSGREFDGVHTETLPGAWFLLRRSLASEPLGLIEAAWSMYVEVPSAAVVVQLALAFALLGFAAVRWFQPLDVVGQIAIAGAVVAAVLVGSPLLSSQFVFWLAPFVVIAGQRRSVLLYTALGAISLVLLVHWRLDEAWWSALALVRVLGIAGLSVLLVGDATTVVADGDHRTARTLARAE